MLLPLAVLFTADNVQIFTVTLDLSVQACKNASLSLANVAWYVLQACSAESIEPCAGSSVQSAELVLFILCISICAN